MKSTHAEFMCLHYDTLKQLAKNVSSARETESPHDRTVVGIMVQQGSST
jgi:hypothetical protein